MDDYLDLHSFIDSTKQVVADARHRLLLHNAFGIFLVERVFGVTFTRKSDGKQVPTRLIAEQHILEDFGRIPTLEEILSKIPLEPWMVKGARALSKQLGTGYAVDPTPPTLDPTIPLASYEEDTTHANVP